MLEVSKSAEARDKNACPELKSTHHLSPDLTFIVLDCSAICCALVHSNFYGCSLSNTAGCLLFGSSLGCGIDLFYFLLLEKRASRASCCENIGGQCVVLNWNRTDSFQCKPRRNGGKINGSISSSGVLGTRRKEVLQILFFPVGLIIQAKEL